MLRSRPRFGPFGSIREFHLWLRDFFDPGERNEEVDDEDWGRIRKMVERQDGAWSAPVFTHGDLCPDNILIRDGQVVGIVGWEAAGWYPEYWEYTTAWLGSMTRRSWQTSLSQFLDPYPEELEMERTRQKWWGEKLKT